jgi:hypothetical protein
MNEGLNFKITKENQKNLDIITAKFRQGILQYTNVLAEKSKMLTPITQGVVIDYCNTLLTVIDKMPCDVNFKDLLHLRDDLDIIILHELQALPQMLNRYKTRCALYQSYYLLEQQHKHLEDKFGVYLISDLSNEIKEQRKNIFERRVSDLKRLSSVMIDYAKKFDESDKLELRKYLDDNHTLREYCEGILMDLENSNRRRNVSRDIGYITDLVNKMSHVELDNEYCSFLSLSNHAKSIIAEMNELIMDSALALEDGV